jgi:hypothetical protein
MIAVLGHFQSLLSFNVYHGLQTGSGLVKGCSCAIGVDPELFGEVGEL